MRLYLQLVAFAGGTILASEKRNRSSRRSGESENMYAQKGTAEEVKRKMRKQSEQGTEVGD